MNKNSKNQWFKIGLCTFLCVLMVVLVAIFLLKADTKTVNDNTKHTHTQAKPLIVGSAYHCANTPRFIGKFGLQQPVAIDTHQSKVVGLVMRELRGQKRLFQHPSWRQTGHVASTVRDAKGNIYVIPVPSVSLETNPLKDRNKIYKVDALTGEMQVFVNLPLPESTSLSNPFGTMGLILDCNTNSLYVSSVAGSTPKQESGVIYQLNLKTGEILDQFNGVDAIGLGIFNFSDHKRLYYGSARSSNVYSIELTKNGGFNKDPTAKTKRYELSLLALKNGDTTQVRKISLYKDKKGQHMMDIAETEFGFRPGADTNRLYKHYLFKLSLSSEKWIYQLSKY